MSFLQLPPLVLNRVASFLTISQVYTFARSCKRVWMTVMEVPSAAPDITALRSIYRWPAHLAREDRRFFMIRTGHMRLFEHEWALSCDEARRILLINAEAAAEYQFNLVSGSVASTGMIDMIRRFLYLWCEAWWKGDIEGLTFDLNRLLALFTNMFHAMLKSQVKGNTIVAIFNDRTVWPAYVRNEMSAFYESPAVVAFLWEYAIRYDNHDAEVAFEKKLQPQLAKEPLLWRKMIFACATNSVRTFMNHWERFVRDDPKIILKLGMKLHEALLSGNAPPDVMTAARNMVPTLGTLVYQLLLKQ